MLPGIYEAVKRHPGAVIASVALHIVLIALLSLSLSSSEVPEQPQPQATTVKAVLVDAAEVDKELQRRKQAEQDKIAQALAEQRRIEQEKKRQAELKKQEAERKKQAELERKREAEKKRKAEAERKEKEEQKRLAAIEGGATWSGRRGMRIGPALS